MNNKTNNIMVASMTLTKRERERKYSLMHALDFLSNCSPFFCPGGHVKVQDMCLILVS
jgi:hypothetical protein